MPEEPGEDEWSRVWNARKADLTAILGEPGGSVFHSPMPFELGGAADVVPFPNYIGGMTYVTAELTGPATSQLPASLGNYELVICVKEPLDVAAEFIANLAVYTREVELEAGETMDIETAFDDSTLRALLFAHPGEHPVQFSVLGCQATLLLCLGITTEELAFARKNGPEALLLQLKRHRVFPVHNSRPTVCSPVGLIAMFRRFLIGFAAGVAFSVLYLMFGEWSWFVPRPQWARIVLAPGLYSAIWAHDFPFRNIQDGNVQTCASIAFGVATMGVVFGALAALLGLGMSRGKTESERV